MSPSPRIPVIDLAPWLSDDPDARAGTAAAVDAALSQAGFLLITGHGVGREERESVREAARAFFALPDGVKQRYGVNIGDLMARWTGDRWKSGRHRVLPPSPDAPEEDLMSLVYFYECDVHTVVEPRATGLTAYEPVDSSDYLRAKLEAISVN